MKKLQRRRPKEARVAHRRVQLPRACTIKILISRRETVATTKLSRAPSRIPGKMRRAVSFLAAAYFCPSFMTSAVRRRAKFVCYTAASFYNPFLTLVALEFQLQWFFSHPCTREIFVATNEILRSTWPIVFNLESLCFRLSFKFTKSIKAEKAVSNPQRRLRALIQFAGIIHTAAWGKKPDDRRNKNSTKKREGNDKRARRRVCKCFALCLDRGPSIASHAMAICLTFRPSLGESEISAAELM